MRRSAPIIVGVALIVACCGIAPSLEPYLAASPTFVLIMVKVHGSKWVYDHMAPSDDSWDRVVRGVRSGDPRWLKVAVAMYAVLDTCPGEDMLDAVADVFEVNPQGAVDTLLPTYGADLVCGVGGYTGAFARARAERRMRVLNERGGPTRTNLIACRNAINTHIHVPP